MFIEWNKNLMWCCLWFKLRTILLQFITEYIPMVWITWRIWKKNSLFYFVYLIKKNQHSYWKWELSDTGFQSMLEVYRLFEWKARQNGSIGPVWKGPVRIKALAAKSSNLSLVPGTQIPKERPSLTSCLRTSMHVQWHRYPHSQVNQHRKESETEGAGSTLSVN